MAPRHWVKAGLKERCGGSRQNLDMNGQKSENEVGGPKAKGVKTDEASSKNKCESSGD